MMFEFKQLISINEAASRLGIAEKTIYNYKGGTEKLTRVRLGRSVRLVESEVDMLVDSQIKGAKNVNKA